MPKDPHGDGQDRIASSLSISRRDFLKKIGVLGGGIIVYFQVGDPAARAQRPARRFQHGLSP